MLQEDVPFPPPIWIGLPVTATFSFASPLAPNSTIPLHLESGGFNLLEPTQGGLEAYSANVSTSAHYRATSDIDEYRPGVVGTVFNYDRYSALDGQVTTDASGNISGWDLDFFLYDDGNGGGISLDKSTNPPTIVNANGFGFQRDGWLSISSDPASHQSITDVTSLNGKQNTDNFEFNEADMAFENRGNVQFTYYTQQPGSIILVPEPESWAMMMAGLGLLGWQIRRLKN